MESFPQALVLPPSPLGSGLRRVARQAQRLQISHLQPRPTRAQRYDVVHHAGRRYAAVLADGTLSPDHAGQPLPGPVVAAGGGVGPVVRRAVGAAPGGDERRTRPCSRLRWPRHSTSLLLQCSTRRLLPRRLFTSRLLLRRPSTSRPRWRRLSTRRPLPLQCSTSPLRWPRLSTSRR